MTRGIPFLLSAIIFQFTCSFIFSDTTGNSSIGTVIDVTESGYVIVESSLPSPFKIGEVILKFRVNTIEKEMMTATIESLAVIENHRHICKVLEKTGNISKGCLVRFPASTAELIPIECPEFPPRKGLPILSFAEPLAKTPPPVPEVPTEERKRRDIVADMILIPQSMAVIGLDASDAAFWNETPRHTVKVDAFYIDRTEVTNADYLEFVKAAGHHPPAHWPNGLIPEGLNEYPVTNVTWEDAAAFARWRQKRLPTEYEWEFAGRGPKGVLFPWGEKFSAKKANTSEGGVGATWPVFEKHDVSSWGVLGLAGNVSEWTGSKYAPYPGNAHNEDGYQKPLMVARGGAYNIPCKYARLVFRVGLAADKCALDLGFRCAIGETEYQDALKTNINGKTEAPK